MIYILLILYIITIIIFIYIIRNINENNFRIISRKVSEVKFLLSDYETRIEMLRKEKDRINEELRIAKENYELDIRNQVDTQNKIIDLEVEKYRAAAQQKLQSYIDQCSEDRIEYEAEIQNIKNILEDFRKQQHSLNELERAARENEDFSRTHSLNLSEESMDDIQFLLSIDKNIHNKEILHKLIWSEYLQKPFKEMIKNIFGSKIPKNVIYCITDTRTNKKYIGKTASSVSDRWTAHIKSSLGIGTIAHQKIHEELFGNWQYFTFTVIEEVTTNLNEREKFYINMYETDKYGLNLKSGG